MSAITAYPLAWPAGRGRTAYRADSKFKVGSFAVVRDELLNELKLMSAKNVVLSGNIRLRQDGLPLAGQRQPDDPGVAVYFTYKGKQVCFACDRWRKVEDNMQAIRHTINALRGIARWGTGDMVDAAFTGFQALPPAPGDEPWHKVLGVDPHAPTDFVRAQYKRLAMEKHPDRGGSVADMSRINNAFSRFEKERCLA